MKGRRTHLLASFRILLVLLAITGSALSQSTDDQQEVVTQDTPVTFESRVNLVLIPVVVRDRDSKAVGTLTKEDFRVFDDGKPQAISEFSVEKARGLDIAIGDTASRGTSATAPLPQRDLLERPERFIAYFFDDLHLNFEDIAQTRSAVEQSLAETLTSNSRVALFTSSGMLMQDLTDDAPKIKAALRRLEPRSRSAQGVEMI